MRTVIERSPSPTANAHDQKSQVIPAQDNTTLLYIVSGLLDLEDPENFMEENNIPWALYEQISHCARRANNRSKR